MVFILNCVLCKFYGIVNIMYGHTPEFLLISLVSFFRMAHSTSCSDIRALCSFFFFIPFIALFLCKASAPCLRRSALQVLHKACEVSRRFNYFPGGIALTWMAFYESCVTSEQSCVNEWNVMTDLETTRPDSPTMFVDRLASHHALAGCSAFVTSPVFPLSDVLILYVQADGTRENRVSH